MDSRRESPKWRCLIVPSYNSSTFEYFCTEYHRKLWIPFMLLKYNIASVCTVFNMTLYRNSRDTRLSPSSLLPAVQEGMHEKGVGKREVEDCGRAFEGRWEAGAAKMWCPRAGSHCRRGSERDKPFAQLEKEDRPTLGPTTEKKKRKKKKTQGS